MTFAELQLAWERGKARQRPVQSEEVMANIPWQAYYYDRFENSGPPARTELIEAACETDAAEVAKSHMGRCKRVEIVGPRWANSLSRVILAGEDKQGPHAQPH
jgi:hypothetical protein